MEILKNQTATRFNVARCGLVFSAELSVTIRRPQSLSGLPPVSGGDSIDWKKPSAEQIKKRVLKNTKSGSILLFHNDLENTTEALPDILKTLGSQGFEFVTVKELVFSDNYTIDANGKQIPMSESSINLSDERIEEVLAQYSDSLTAAGVTEEQIEAAVAAIKRGDLSVLPAELQPLAAEVMARVTPSASSSTSSTTSTEQK